MPRVLVVDDDEDVVTLIRMLFESAGYQSCVPSACAQAAEAAAELLPDLMLLDVRMPSASGWEVMEAVRANPQTRSIPIIMISATSQVDERVRAIREGADDFVSKPFDGPELLARAERVLARSRAERAEVAESGLRGSLEMYPLHVLIQSLEQHRHTGTLDFHGGVEPAFISFENGVPFAVRDGALSGEEALWSLLERTSGQFTYNFAPAANSSGRQSLRRSVQSLLLDAAWVEDELNRRRDLLPEIDQPLFLSAEPMPEIEEEARELVEVVREALRRRHGISLRQLLQELAMAPMRLRFAVSLLGSIGQLRFAPGDGGVELAAIERGSAAEATASEASVRTLCVLVAREALVPAQNLLATAPAGAEIGGDLEAASSGGVRIGLGWTASPVEIWLFRSEMSAVAAIFERAKRSDAVLLWMSEETSELAIPPRLLAAAAGRKAQLTMLNAGPAVRRRLGGTPSRLDGSWQMATSSPATVLELLRLGFSGNDEWLEESLLESK